MTVEEIKRAIALIDEVDRLQSKGIIDVEEIASHQEMCDICYDLHGLLKNELERVGKNIVELPCKIGDVVYVLEKCKNINHVLDGTMYDSSGGFGSATGYYCPYELSNNCPHKDIEDCSEGNEILQVFEDFVQSVYIDCDEVYFHFSCCNSVKMEMFGKTVFLTKAEAEKALEERKNNDK